MQTMYAPFADRSRPTTRVDPDSTDAVRVRQPAGRHRPGRVQPPTVPTVTVDSAPAASSSRSTTCARARAHRPSPTSPASPAPTPPRDRRRRLPRAGRHGMTPIELDSGVGRRTPASVPPNELVSHGRPSRPPIIAAQRHGRLRDSSARSARGGCRSPVTSRWWASTVWRSALAVQPAADLGAAAHRRDGPHRDRPRRAGGTGRPGRARRARAASCSFAPRPGRMTGDRHGCCPGSGTSTMLPSPFPTSTRPCASSSRSSGRRSCTAPSAAPMRRSCRRTSTSRRTLPSSSRCCGSRRT